jgi:lipoprotein-anchoring transpeptidase ErfK/SrfK
LYWILVRLSRRRLFLYQDNRLVKSYPIGIGKMLTRTPVGNYTIVSKVPYPYSHPGGRLTPYGTYWMGLSRPGYGIHGTNQPWSIGKRVSHGCIRMYNQNVEELARMVRIGTPVQIRN